MDINTGNKLIAVVYKITNLINSKFYIGSSVNFPKRKKRHLDGLRYGTHHCKPLQRAYNKYGKENFTIEIIEKFEAAEKKDILNKEQYYLDTLKPQYNVCLTAGSQLGAIRNAIFKTRCSERMKGKAAWNKGLSLPKQSEETKQKRANSLLGGKRSEATKKLMSEKAKGKIFSETHRLNLAKSKITHGKYSKR